MSINSVIKEAIPGSKRNIDYKLSISKGSIFIAFNGLDSSDISLFTNNKFYKAYLSRFDKNSIYVKVDANENVSDYLNGVIFNKIWTTLGNSGKYNMPDLNTLKLKATDLISKPPDPSKPTTAEIETSFNKVNDLYEHIITTLNSPETQRLVKTLNRINVTASMFGSMISTNNAAYAYSAKHDATYVLAASRWRAMNRSISPNATKIIQSVPIGLVKDEAQGKLKTGLDRSDIGINQHKKQNYDKQSNVGVPTGFRWFYAYDVSDTYVIPGLEDLWTGNTFKSKDTSGMVDNIKGLLNQAAYDEMDKAGTNSPDFTPTDNSSKNKLFCERFIRFITDHKLTDDVDLNHYKDADLSNDNTVFSLLNDYFRNYSFEREHDTTMKNTKVNTAIATILSIQDVAESKFIQLIARHNDVIKYLKNKLDFIQISNQVMKVINGVKDTNADIADRRKLHNLDEDANSYPEGSPEYIMNLFGVKDSDLNSDTEDTKNEIRESFYNTLNKIIETQKRWI